MQLQSKTKSKRVISNNKKKTKKKKKVLISNNDNNDNNDNNNNGQKKENNIHHQPCNALLSTHWLLLLDHTEISVLLDNEGIYEICQKWLHIKTSSYDNLNRIISKVISSMTASLRFEGELNVGLNEFQTNLVPFPRLHFITTSK